MVGWGSRSACYAKAPPQAGHAGPEAQFLRRELPPDAGIEHEQDAAQDLFLAATPAGGGDRPHPPPGLRSA
jgi:hypothetical protein